MNDNQKSEESDIENEIPIFGALPETKKTAVQLKFMGNVLQCARHSTVEENRASVMEAFEILTGFPASDLIFTEGAELSLYSIKGGNERNT